MNTNIAEIVTNKRLKLNMTREEFAAYLGVKSYNLSKWERGDSRPKADMLLRIMDIRKK